LNILKEIRQKKGLTQEEVASKLYLTTSAYQNYELDKAEPNIQTYIRLSGLYNKSIDELVGNELKYNSQQLECLEYISQLNQANLIQAIFYIKTLLLYQQQKN